MQITTAPVSKGQWEIPTTSPIGHVSVESAELSFVLELAVGVLGSKGLSSEMEAGRLMFKGTSVPPGSGFDEFNVPATTDAQERIIGVQVG